MIAIDTNVLVYAHRGESEFHQAAKARVVALAEGAARWAIPVFCLGEFVRVTTHRRLLDPPFTVEEACTALERVLASPTLRILMPGQRYWTLLAQALREGDTAGNLALDAQIVALCRERGVHRLLTQDRDFARFADFPTESL